MLLVLGALTLIIVACKKPITEPNAGIYRGVFFQIFDNGDTNSQGIASLALSVGDQGNYYTLSGDTLTGSPKSCYGNYSIDNSTHMTFTNNAIGVEPGFWPHYYLDTTYAYEFDDYNFTLEMREDTVLYQYILTRN